MYQPYFTHEPKSKPEHHKSSQPSLVVTKSGTPIDSRDVLPNPPPLMSEMKSSVIVKHDTGKNTHHLEPRVSMAHSPSPKMRSDMLSTYHLPTGQPKSNLYEYRSPTQSPHHLSHAPSPHHNLEPQNLGKSAHHRQSNQLPSPHHQRQSPHHPHAQQHPSPELRYRTTSDSQAMVYPTTGKSNYAFLSSTTSAYSLSSTNTSNSKPKVSSPAPHHIYGKPSAGIVAGVPVTRHESAAPIQLTAKPPLSSSVSPSPYQQVSQYHPPHPQTTPTMTCPPPPAHSRITPSDPRYDRYAVGSVPGGLSVKASVQHHGTSPPTAASAPLAVTRSHPQYMPGVTVSVQSLPGAPSVQTQPLDLGVSSNKYEPAVSPKRKATPVSSGSPVCLETKKRRIEAPQQPLPIYVGAAQPQLARVSEPSPLIVSAAATITTVVNTAAYRTPSLTSSSPNTDSLADVCVTAVSAENPVRPSSVESTQTSVQLSSSPAPNPPSTQSETEAPNTPVKLTIPPSCVDSEKSNSPGPTKSSTYPVRHLKKAWLQRHTGEDVEDNTGVTGSGSCVTLPIISMASNNKENPIHSIHSIGSMAVNSISKTKHFSNKPNNRKTPNKETLNGHPNDSAKGDDSSSSDQDRGRKSPPKRKPPKVKRKKGGSSSKKTSEEKKRKPGSQSVVVSESGSDSEKESGSEKDSDSGASTTLAPGKKSNSVSKEPRKRGRRPKSSKNDKGEEPRIKKSKDETVPQRDPFRKPPVGQLKKTGESFLQDGPCFEVAPKLAKCRECRWTPNQRSKNMPNIFCRFYAFRRLRYTKNGQLAIAGFSDPHKDALEVSRWESEWSFEGNWWFLG